MTDIGQARQALIALGGVAAVLGLYWDDAWHTDVGRDSFFAPPHRLLYAGVGLLLVTAGWWAAQRYRRDGWSAFRDLTLTLPLVGAAVTLAAAPVDELWHELFGRDAVVWSPPHMVAVAGMLAFAAGLYLAVHRGQERPSPVAGAIIGAFLIAAAGTVVMEFEADVPQFPVITYLPVNTVGLTFAFALIHRGSGRAWAATRAAAVYVILRVLVVGFLALLGHSTPTVMPTVVAAGAFDLAVQRGWARWAIAASTALAAAASHALAHAVQPAGLTISPAEVLLGAVVGAVAALGVLRTVGVGSRQVLPTGSRLAGITVLCVGMLVVAQPAFAHDPGQGQEIAPVVLTAIREDRHVELQVAGRPGHCDTWQPRRIVARRAGQTLTAPLSATHGCTFRGAVEVTDPGRWFIYAEVDIAGDPTESWIPVDEHHQTKETVLYPSPPSGTPIGQVVAGSLLYLLVAAILAVVTITYRRTTAAMARQ